MSRSQTTQRVRRGFTLVELAVVIVIIGVLAAFGVPKFLNSVERSKAAEAFSYLSAVRSAQERYLAREGTYAANASDLDISFPAPKYFTVGTPFTASGSGTSLENSWQLTLTRTGSSAGYGAYTVTFTDQGYDPTNSTIDQYPAINPMGTDPNAGSQGSGS
jgi:type IV pilus assembly protein PilA